MATVDEILTRQAYAAGDETWTKDNNYPSYTMYAEPEYVPVTNKRIADFNDQVSVRGEQNAQFVGFQLPRYDDAMDLSTQNLYIHYQTVYGGSDGVPCNVSWSDNYVRMCWMIPGQATQEPGSIQMMIYATGTDSVGDRTVWKTLPATYTIHDGLEIGGGIPEPDQSWYEQFVAQMEDKVSTAQGYANDAQASKTAAAGSATAAAQSADASAQALAENKDYVESQKETFVGYNKRETDLKYANALIGSASGTGRVTVGDAWDAPIPDLRISGEIEQVSTTGAQLFDVNDKFDRIPFSDGITVDDDGWITITGSNPNNYMSTKYFFTNPNLNLQPETEYLCIFEVASNPSNLTISYITNNTDGTQGQFIQSLSSKVSKITVVTTREDFSDCVTCMRGMLILNPNTDAFTIKFRISLIADTTMTLDNFIWEPYTGGHPSPSPEYPQPIINTGTVTTGAQLMDADDLPSEPAVPVVVSDNGRTIQVSGTMARGRSRYVLDLKKVAGRTLYVSGTISSKTVSNASTAIVLCVQNADDTWVYKYIREIGSKMIISAEIPVDAKVVRVDFNINDSDNILPNENTAVFKDIMLSIDKAFPWEPYTGGKPSPSEAYPQPLDVTVTGENLCEMKLPTKTIDGLTYTPNKDGSFSIVGTSTAGSSTAFRIDQSTISGSDNLKNYVDGQYTFSITTDSDISNLKFDIMQNNTWSTFIGVQWGQKSKTANIANATDCFVFIAIKPGATVNVAAKIQLEHGTLTPWKPYQSKTATIQLTSPLYGIGDVRDRIMCKDGEWGIERQFIALTFDGSENWEYHGTAASDQFRLALSNYMGVIKNEENADKPIKIMCDRLKAGSSSNTYGRIDCISSNTSGRIYIYLDDFSSGDVAAFKTYLSTHPIRAIFERATPTWEPLPAATQSALNALATFTGTTHITITAGGPEPDVAVEYVQDTKAVIADIMAQINEIRNGGTT